MSCPSAICTSLTNAAVTENGSAGFGSIVRRYGKGVQLNGSGIDLFGSGYFKLDASMSVTPTDAGPVTLQFYQDNVAITGASATAQATAGNPVDLSVSFLLRNCGCACNSTLTYTVDADGTIVSFPVVVEKR